jgi:hypothetical protein
MKRNSYCSHWSKPLFRAERKVFSNCGTMCDNRPPRFQRVKAPDKGELEKLVN